MMLQRAITTMTMTKECASGAAGVRWWCGGAERSVCRARAASRWHALQVAMNLRLSLSLSAAAGSFEKSGCGARRAPGREERERERE